MKNKLFYLAVLVALVIFSGTASARPLDAPHTDSHASGGFSNASFQGSYALTGFVGANVAAIVGVCNFDGSGHFDCTYTGNAPGEDGTRTVFPITDEGDYTVNADGTGTIHEFETIDGVTSEYNHNIVIVDAEAIGPYVVATELFGLVDQTDASGSLFTSHYDRLPDVGMAATTEEINKAAVYAWAEALSSGDPEVVARAVDKYYAIDYVVHNPNLPAGLRGREEIKKLILEGLSPDFHSTVEDVVAEGDKVAYRLTLTGHDPNDPAAELTVLNITHFVNGQIAEEWELP